MVSVGVWKSRTRRRKTDRKQKQSRINGKEKVLKYWGKKDRKEPGERCQGDQKTKFVLPDRTTKQKLSPCFPQLFVFVLHSSTCSVKCKRKFQIHLGAPTSFLPNSLSFTGSSSHPLLLEFSALPLLSRINLHYLY